MSDEEKLKNVLEKTADLLRSALPIVEHGSEVCEYVIPAGKYLAALHSVTDFKGMQAHEMKRPAHILEIPSDC